jgi:hypothetical protein
MMFSHFASRPSSIIILLGQGLASRSRFRVRVRAIKFTSTYAPQTALTYYLFSLILKSFFMDTRQMMQQDSSTLLLFHYPPSSIIHHTSSSDRTRTFRYIRYETCTSPSSNESKLNASSIIHPQSSCTVCHRLNRLESTRRIASK